MSDMTSIGGTPATKIQRRAIELRLDGLSLEAVGESLGVPTAVATGHLIEALKRIPDLLEAEVEAILALELHRLDALQVPLWPKAEAGDNDAVESILNIMVHRARLTGIYVD